MTNAALGEESLAGRGIGVVFGGVSALRDVDVELRRGDWTGLIGPNGSGKSTLLNVLSGVYSPRAGTVTLGGVEITRASPRRRARRGIVRTFQHPQLASTISIGDNVRLGADLARRRGRPVARVGDLLDSLGIARYEHDLPERAPYGVRKVAEVARALAADPEYLLLDEPAAGLSARERNDLVTTLRAMRSARPSLAVCLVEHDVAFIAAVVDRIVALNVGQVLSKGPAEEVLRDPRVRAAYIGDDPAAGPAESHQPMPGLVPSVPGDGGHAEAG